MLAKACDGANSIAYASVSFVSWSRQTEFFEKCDGDARRGEACRGTAAVEHWRVLNAGARMKKP